MEYKDYYRILGVDKDASPDEVRAAYRKLARKYHPDVNPNNKAAEERFKDINEAHEVLHDAEKRRKYDQLGADWQRYQQMGGAADGFDWSQWFSSGGGGAGGHTRTEYVDLNDLFGEGSFSDFFEYIFGGAAPRGDFAGSAQRSSLALDGRDIEQPVDISLEEAYSGTARVFQMGPRRIEVRIPAGVQTGSRVRVGGEGEAGRNSGQPGDLYLIITVREHPDYRREGDDLRKTLPIDLYTLILGGEVLVDTFKGRVSLKVPPETKAGQAFRLRGRGMPRLRNPDRYGDLYVEVEPIIPQNLSESERELYRRLSDMRGTT
jgi:curved DNA-binding protein